MNEYLDTAAEIVTEFEGKTFGEACDAAYWLANRIANAIEKETTSLVRALKDIRDIKESDCTRYVVVADKIACEALAEWEENHGQIIERRFYEDELEKKNG